MSVGKVEGLGQRLRAATKELHAEVERAGIMPALLRGELDRPHYCALLRNLHALYTALEAALTRHAARADLAPVVLPALFRKDSLEADLGTLHGTSSWAEDFVLQAATRRYLARLARIDAQQPQLLAAHAYVRYLGDLSGGQMLGQIVARGMGLTSGAATAFYEFGSSATVAALKQRFRAGLDRLASDEAGIGALVAEARGAFEMHRDLFTELGGAPLRAAP